MTTTRAKKFRPTFIEEDRADREAYANRERDEFVDVLEMIFDRLGPAELSEIADEIDAKMNRLIGAAIARRGVQSGRVLRVIHALRRACPPSFLGDSGDESG